MRISETEARLSVHIARDRAWSPIVMLALALCSLGSGVLVLISAFAIPSFSVFMVSAPLLFVGAYMASVSLWRPFMEEEIRVQPQLITWRRGGLRIYRTWEIPGDRVRSVRAAPTLGQGFAVWNIGVGSVVIEHDHESSRLGLGLDGADAQRVCMAVTDRLGLAHELVRIVFQGRCALCNAELPVVYSSCGTCDLGYCDICAPTAQACLGCNGRLQERTGGT